MMYCIVDIETTGNGIKGNKITEIAIFKYDGEKVVDEFTSLVNPQSPIPFFITGLTGIDDQMVALAPTFQQIANKILKMTLDCIFVAHSVNFDYGVIKEEFRQIGIDFIRKKLCTVRLSRKLVPGLRSYSLGKLCTAVGIEITDRHRARGDAYATTILFEVLLKKPQADKIISSFLNARSQEATLPPNLDKKVIDRIPQKPGIYYFKNSSGTIIYVGKANNLKKRVLGHFYDKSNKELRMCQEIADIDFQLSGSELLALLMESSEIKKHFPSYNRAQKRITKSYAIFSYEDRNGFQHLAFGPKNKSPKPIKIFYNQNDCRAYLKHICSEFLLCEKYCQLRKTPCSKGFSNCEGACSSDESPFEYNVKVAAALKYMTGQKASYLIKEKGRDNDENVLISVSNGIYQGYAFIPKEAEIRTVNDLEAYLIRHKNTVETERIISGYLIRNKRVTLYEWDSSLEAAK